mmetsp:Transcript_19558/g.60300  ORF Transcript_19558/g.60300 Transcript_19558/m.60300 type:complete len:118 (+) Transcript_19558:295-648(+)
MPAHDYGATMSSGAPPAADATETDRLLEDSLAKQAETEQMGSATLNQMRGQTEQLDSATVTARDTQRVTKEAKRTLSDIACSILREKLVLGGIILVFLAIDVYLAYLLIKNKGSFSK